MVSYAEVKSYLSKREIPQLFESLMAGLMYHRPENHIGYLQTCLEEVKTAGDPSNLQWSMFVSGKKRKSKELPPVTPKKQETLPWTENSRQSTPLPPISAKSRGPQSRYLESEGHRSSLRSTYILYHNPPPMLTPPTVPVIFLLGGLGCKIDTLCEEVVGRLRGVVHISTCSMLKTRMTIEGFYRTTSVPACAVVDSVLQAMSMVQSARAMLVAGFPRNRGDIEEYRSRQVRMDGVVLVDFEEEALRTFLDSEVESGMMKLSEVEFELDRYKQDLISVAEYYDDKDLLTVVMGDQETEDIINDLVIAVDRVVETRSQISVEESLATTDGRYQRCKSNGPCAALENSPSPKLNGDDSETQTSSDEIPAAAALKADMNLQNVSNLSLIVVFGRPKVGLKAIKNLIANEYMMRYIDFNILLERSQCTDDNKCQTNQEADSAEVNNDRDMFLLKKEMLMHLSTVRGFCISGFPRNLKEAERFEKEVGFCDAVVVFENMGKEKLSPDPNSDVLAYFDKKIKRIQDPEVSISDQISKILDDIVRVKSAGNETSETPQLPASSGSDTNDSVNVNTVMGMKDQVADDPPSDAHEAVDSTERTDLSQDKNDTDDQISSNTSKEPDEVENEGEQNSESSMKTAELLESDEARNIKIEQDAVAQSEEEAALTNSDESKHELQEEIQPERGKESIESCNIVPETVTNDGDSNPNEAVDSTADDGVDPKKGLLIRQQTFSATESNVEDTISPQGEDEKADVAEENNDKGNSDSELKASEAGEDLENGLASEGSNSQNVETELPAEENVIDLAATNENEEAAKEEKELDPPVVPDVSNDNDQPVVGQAEDDKSQKEVEENPKDGDRSSEITGTVQEEDAVELEEKNKVENNEDGKGETEEQKDEEEAVASVSSHENVGSNIEPSEENVEVAENEQAGEENGEAQNEEQSNDDGSVKGSEPDSSNPTKEPELEQNVEPSAEPDAEQASEDAPSGEQEEEAQNVGNEENEEKGESVEEKESESQNESEVPGNNLESNAIDDTAEDTKSNEGNVTENDAESSVKGEEEKVEDEAQNIPANDDPLQSKPEEAEVKESDGDIQADDADTMPSITLTSEVAQEDSKDEEEIDGQSIKAADDESLSQESGIENANIEETNLQPVEESADPSEKEDEKPPNAEPEEVTNPVATEMTDDQSDVETGDSSSKVHAQGGESPVKETPEGEKDESDLDLSKQGELDGHNDKSHSNDEVDAEEKTEAHPGSDRVESGGDAPDEVENSSASAHGEGNETNSDLDTVEKENQSNHERNMLTSHKSQEDSLSPSEHAGDSGAYIVSSARSGVYISSGKLERGDLHRNGSDLMAEGETSRDQREEEPQERSSSSSRGEL